MSQVDGEIRALKRELVGSRAKHSQDVRNEIMAQLAARGVKDAGVPAGVEKRGPGRPKKSAETAE